MIASLHVMQMACLHFYLIVMNLQMNSCYIMITTIIFVFPKAIQRCVDLENR